MILFVIFLMITILACSTVKEKEYVTIKYILPPSPQRKEMILRENPSIKDYAEIINYYEHLVREWEAWGKNVKEIIKKP